MPQAARSEIAAANGADDGHVRSAGSGADLGSIGVVYGDIGTSPLYAVRESVLAAVGPNAPASEEVILGILSLIVWALILIVSIKYVTILLRANNNGEGGTLALMALAQRAIRGRGLVVIALGMISAALFYGDAMITPALSVLSAVEGLEVDTGAGGLRRSAGGVILFGLFAVQSRVPHASQPSSVHHWFGFRAGHRWRLACGAKSAVLGAQSCSRREFSLNHGVIDLDLGGVFVVTGSEALYADLGHLSGPIRTAWFAVAPPALTINYLGQGALLGPEAIENPFSALPGGALPSWSGSPRRPLSLPARR
jgi:KUP system potassium uptake protein